MEEELIVLLLVEKDFVGLVKVLCDEVLKAILISLELNEEFGELRELVLVQKLHQIQKASFAI